MSNDDQASSPSEKDDKSSAASEVKTGGGPYVAGNVNMGGGDFTGHDKHIHGDEVHGDKVIGDQTTVGEVKNSIGVAIGPGATANVYNIQEAPKSRMPLERPPRAAHFQDRKAE